MGYALPITASARYEALGTGTGIGTTVSANASANTKGSYATLGTASFAYDGFFLFLLGPASGSNVAQNLVDIAVNNGGSDQVVVENFYSGAPTSSSVAQSAGGTFIPVRIPSGAIVKARSQATTGSVNLSVHIVGFQGAAGLSKGFRKLACLADLTNSNVSNTLTLSGTSLTGYTQIAASTSIAAAGLILALDERSTSSMSTTAHSLWDVAMGGAGSEVVVLPKIGIYLNSASRFLPIGPFPVDIPAGKRLAVRAQTDVADTNVLSMFLYGLVP